MLNIVDELFLIMGLSEKDFLILISQYVLVYSQSDGHSDYVVNFCSISKFLMCLQLLKLWNLLEEKLFHDNI